MKDIHQAQKDTLQVQTDTHQTHEEDTRQVQTDTHQIQKNTR